MKCPLRGVLMTAQSGHKRTRDSIKSNIQYSAVSFSDNSAFSV
jgi:hypothetical protein